MEINSFGMGFGDKMGMDVKPRHWWPGGFIRFGKKRPTYVIERWVGGVKFKVSTRASTLGAAMKHLDRFEADPDGYAPADGRVRLALTAELALQYRDYQVEQKKVSREWANNCGRFLADWADDLAGKDLAKLNLQQDVKPALARPTRAIPVHTLH